tara:strand:+ start:58 stop:324 length:267 start_codon:yes stop_codon:yes gene_type:complete
MEKHPLAWAFFIPFILVTTFTFLNLMVAVMVNAMDSDSGETENKTRQNDKEEIIEEIRLLREELKELKIEKRIKEKRGKYSPPPGMNP